MKLTFNLDKFNKKAFYDGGNAAIKSQTRCMMNCYKAKMDAGKTANEARESCVEEYNNAKNNDWSTKYS